MICSCVAVSRRPRCIQAAVTGGDPKDKEREEAETEWEEAEGDRKPQASGQCQSGPEKLGVCGGALAASCWPRGEYELKNEVTFATHELIFYLMVIQLLIVMVVTAQFISKGCDR